MLRQITQSPYLNLFSGLILLATSIYEIALTVDEASFGIRHGILIFSLVQIIKVIPEIVRGLTEIQEADEMMEQQNSRLVQQDAN